MANKRFEFFIQVEFTQAVEDKNLEKAVEQLKETFKQEFNLDISDDEIKLVNGKNYND